MEHIIAARFPATTDAEAAVARMPWVDPADICIFLNSPPGQHGALGALGGPVVAIAAAAVGAYAGSLVGATAGMGDEGGHPPAEERRQAGVMLSVRIAEPSVESRVIAVLRTEGAMDIERAQGEWRDGDWIDFDPLAAPRLIEPTPGAR